MFAPTVAAVSDVGGPAADPNGNVNGSLFENCLARPIPSVCKTPQGGREFGTGEVDAPVPESCGCAATLRRGRAFLLNFPPAYLGLTTSSSCPLCQRPIMGGIAGLFSGPTRFGGGCPAGLTTLPAAGDFLA